MQKYENEYKGIITNVNDPKNLGRARIRIKGLFDELPEESIPWASVSPAAPGARGGSSTILAKGQKVWVRFLEGDINFPVFRGGVIESTADLPKNFAQGRAVIYESPNKDICLAVSEDLEDIEIKVGAFNTTLKTIIEQFLAHTHMTPTGVSGTVTTGVPPITDLDFKTGALK